MGTKIRVLSTLLVLCSHFAKAQLVTEFTATPTSGCAPLVVNFSDMSTGNPTQWKWDLGNGTTSTLRNPSVTYFDPGQYNVKLVIQNAGGKDSIVKNQYITIYDLPVINFGASALSGCFPLNVQFADSSIVNSGTVNSWLWDFGDGNTSTLQNPAHVYTASGYFNVSLRVGTSVGCSKSATRTRYMRIFEGVSADFSNNQPSTCTPPANVNFQNLSTGNGALSFTWNFGDGNTSSQLNPSHNYISNGNYTVQLIVVNSNGCADTLTRPNAVNFGSVHADFNPPATLCAGIIPYLFTNTSSPAPVSAFWDFGDGTTSTDINPQKYYAMPGNYFVKLVSNFGTCSDSSIRSVVVFPKPNAGFSTTQLTACQLPFTVTFTNESVNGISYLWDFGDGTTSTLANPTHTYTTEDDFTITLVTTNANGCTDTITRTEYVHVKLPQITMNNLPQFGCEPFTWTFQSTVESSDSVVRYLWDFGDGTTDSVASPTHTFDSGQYHIKVYIYTASGCMDSAILRNAIRVGTYPHAIFQAAPLTACANVPINFTDSSTGTITRWFWQFGDGGTSNLQHPTYVYTDTGYFDVTLIVYNQGCTDTLIFEDYIHIDPPIANFSFTMNCRDKLRRVFRDRSIGAHEWNWDFGDGTTSTDQNPVHVYSAPGLYSVSLTVRNHTTGCEYTRIRDVRVLDEVADFIGLNSVACKNSPVTFLAVNSNPANISRYTWNFGDGQTGSNDTVSHSYAQSGQYNVTLIIQDILNCRDTIVRPQVIEINGPTANFASGTPGSCLMTDVVFNDSSFTDGTNNIVSWTWDFGDGNIQTMTSGPFQHHYSATGIYSVGLTVTDNFGCSDQKTIDNLLTISKPVASFSSPDTLTCPGRPVRFTSTSTGPQLTYTWNYDDGNTGGMQNSSHPYSTDGIYSITLNIIDQYGCRDSITKPSYIRVISPIASFDVSDSAGNCPPLVVDFTNTSLNATSLQWDFGDGTTSTLSDPSHFYSIPGTYVARLTATGIGGCTSVFERNIHVRGPYGSFSYTPISGCRPLEATFVATTVNRDQIIWDFSDGTTMTTTDSVVSHTYLLPGTYVPKMILLNSAGCQVPIYGIDTIRVNGIVTAFDFNATTFCDNGTVQFTNASVTDATISGFTWDFGDGTFSNDENPVHFYDTVGTYYPSLTVINNLGCRDSLTSVDPVKVVKKPEANIIRSGNGCSPLNVNFTGSLQNPDTSSISWQWNFGNGEVSTLISPPAQAYTLAGDYQVSVLVTNSSGCMDTATTTISSYPLPLVNAGDDTYNCFRQGRQLTVTGAASYSWTPSTALSCTNCPNPVTNPDSLITYVVTGTNQFGCQAKDTVVIDVKYPINVSASRGDTLCLGSAVRLYANGAHIYNWSPAAGLNNPNAANPIAAPTQTTNYTLVGSDVWNCFKDTVHVPITVFPIPTVEAGEDLTINVGKTIDLIPVISPDVTHVTWSPTGSIFRSTYPAITVRPKETTRYVVEVSNGGGCKATDHITVNVLCNGANVFIPNTFSPNGDGMNDIFYTRGTGLFTIHSIRIFNRWGEMVFEKTGAKPNDPVDGWNGTYKGSAINPDVYVYVIEITCENNTRLSYKGNIAVIK
jgi:gliding motility-associated-like protein